MKAIFDHLAPLMSKGSGVRLREIRERHALSQTDLAQHLGIRQGTLSKIERRSTGNGSFPVSKLFEVFELKEVVYILTGNTTYSIDTLITSDPFTRP